MSNTLTINRRGFLKVSTAACGGLLIGTTWLSACGAEGVDYEDLRLDAKDFVELNAYIKIASNGVVTIQAPNPEIGQGVKTALPMLVAEELDIHWEKVIVEQAPLNTDHFTRQVAGGSGSVREAWIPFRKAGAMAKYLLLAAAAQEWGVDHTELTCSEGYISHPTSQRREHFGTFVTTATTIEPPEDIELKPIKDFKLIGTFVRNVDNKSITTGQPLFGIDTRREGMKFAMVVRPPAFGQTLASVDDILAKNSPGIVDVVTYDDKVAIIGESTWKVKKARDLLKIEWNTPEPLESTQGHTSAFESLINQNVSDPKRKDGNVSSVLKDADEILEATYTCPFLPHACMEPMNFFAHVQEDSIELFGPIQLPQRARGHIAKKLEVDESIISVGLTRMGGGFGRRLYMDFVEDAAMISKLSGHPIQVVYTREDDMTAGIYRPAGMYNYRAALKSNSLVGWHLRSAAINTGNGTRENNFPAGAISNFQVDYLPLESKVTIGAWRAPNHNFIAFSEECFLDEIAHKLNQDPLEFRLQLLEQAKLNTGIELPYDADRYTAVIKKVAEMSNWGTPSSQGRYQGFGAHFSFGTYVAQVAEIEIIDGEVKVHQVYCAVDCGIVVNKSGALNQIEGGIIDGLGHAMYGELSIQDGKPNHKNFDTYRLVRMGEVPKIEITFIENGIDPQGLGEPGLPPIPAAIGNAIFAATGQRIRSLPFANNPLAG
jgi:isoquinoline 1-oxidoreductase beta subunit